MKKITKISLLKKGKEVFGTTEKFNMWLNTEHIILECKPITQTHNPMGNQKGTTNDL
jgi:hypothetical protein